MADDDSSDLSSLSSLSPVPSEDESEVQLRKENGILKFFHKVPKGQDPAPSSEAVSPQAKRHREPSPPHEEVLEDNQDIAFIVMFRNRLSEAFPKNLPNLGPQELEHDIVDSVPGERIEHFICALLKLLLNRQQDVKPGHYNRALEEAVLSHKSQWVAGWDENPLAGGKTFSTMTPTERLTLLRALILWTMSSSKTVHDIIDHAYKNKRHDDDANIAMSVQPFGSDSDKRRYFLIEGQDDTAFRVYRESNPAGFLKRTWWSVAGSIDDIRTLIEKLETKDGGPKARKLARRLHDEIPRFEATEEKRRRREYRQHRRDQFKRPDPGFSVYEGRTRGKRIKYTYSDDDDFLSDSTGPRRSSRRTGTHTPAEPAGPVTTASGRQVRAPNRLNGDAGAAGTGGLPSAATSVLGDGELSVEEEPLIGPTGRPRRSAAIHHSMNGWSKKAERQYEYNSDEEDDDSEPDLGNDEDEEEDEHVPEGNDDDDDDDEFDEDKDALLDDEDEELGDGGPRSVMVKIPVHAVLDRETGKWAKAARGKKLVRKADLQAAESSPTTPSDGDVTMSESIQSSAETANSPERTADEISVAIKTVTTDAGAKAESIEAKPGPNGTAPASTDRSAQKPLTRPGTPGKEDAPALVSVAPLAFRSSPEKSHPAPRAVNITSLEG